MSDYRILILIADDEASIREVISLSLQEKYLEAVEIHEASDGEETIKLLKNNKFSLCILDLKMPSINGLEVVQYLKNSERHLDNKSKTPVLVVSGFVDSIIGDDGTTCIDGLDETISKPFKIDKLLERVEKLLNSKSHNR